MKHILLVEDNDEIRENTAEILELAGYKVYAAPNGKAGIELAINHLPDLIVCDVMMPVLDGYGMLHLLQKNQELNRIPFIFLTAKAERTDLRKGMEMGADDYITKPFSDIELLTAIERRLLKADTQQSQANVVQVENDETPTETALARLLAECPSNHYKKKQVIYTEGNHPVRLFYVQKGKVKIFRSHDNGKELTVGLFGPGDYFGYTALLQHSVYRESSEAMEDTELLVIPQESFEQLLKHNRQVAQFFIRLLASEVDSKEKQLVNIAYNSLRKRVADALVQLQEKYGKPGDAPFSIHISREDLAQIAGTATESLIRTLSDFKSEKLIDIREGNIVLLDEQKLANMRN